MEVPLLLQTEEHPSASAKLKSRVDAGKIEAWMVGAEAQEGKEGIIQEGRELLVPKT